MANTELAKAYVQIVPSAKGIKGSISSVLDPEATSAGKTSGKSAGAGIASGIKKAIVAAGIGKIIKEAVSEGAALEQSIGGMETLYKENADTMIKYANEAYKTAGLSANEYMETATSFSASLLSALGGDTAKAAEAANQAIIDMSDNVNKMGVSMESVQNAYRGFAKGNYTMLDNLALGYGGTKTEMERLLADAQELTGIEYDISNLSDVYSAIHVIQNEIGITGTTAKEAAETLSGSLASMKAAAQNVLGALTTGTGLSDALTNLGTTVFTFVENNLVPMLANAFSSLPDVLNSLLPMIQEGLVKIAQNAGGIVEFATTLISRLAESITSNSPTMFETAVSSVIDFAKALTDPSTISSLVDSALSIIKTIAQGLIDALPELANEAAPTIILNLVTGFTENLPKIIDSAADIIGALAEGLVTALPTLITSTIPQIIIGIVKALVTSLPKIVAAGGRLITSLASGAKQYFSTMFTAFGDLGKKLVNKIKEWISPINDAGKNLVEGLWTGISDKVTWLKEKIKGFCDTAIDAIKGFFGIHSPSKVMAKEVGKWIPAGVANGIAKNTSPVSDAMKSLADTTSMNFKQSLPSTRGYVSNASDKSKADSLMEKYLPYLADNKKVEVVLQGDARGVFNLVRRESDRYTDATGNPAFG